MIEKLDIRLLEKSLAYEHACSLLDSGCREVKMSSNDFYLDLRDCNCQLREVVEYLEARGLLLHHPHIAFLVKICDEDEPVGAVFTPAGKGQKGGLPEVAAVAGEGN